MSNIKPRPSLQRFIQLPKGQKVLYAQPYRKAYKEYPKWQFWRSKEVKYYIAIVTGANRVYIVDPDAETVEEVIKNA